MVNNTYNTKKHLNNSNNSSLNEKEGGKKGEVKCNYKPRATKKIQRFLRGKFNKQIRQDRKIHRKILRGKRMIPDNINLPAYEGMETSYEDIIYSYFRTILNQRGYSFKVKRSGFLEFSKYKCYKEVSVDTGYEYEYSGYVD